MKPLLNEQAKDLLDGMLRSLPLDRYKMKVHYEDQPVAAPTLIAVRPKRPRAYPRRGRRKTSAPASARTSGHAFAPRSAIREPLVFDASSSLNSEESLGSAAQATTIDVPRSNKARVAFMIVLQRLSSEPPMIRLDTGTEADGTDFRYRSRRG